MNRNTVETIKQKLSIESVVSSYIKLTQTGKTFKACCPFHNEKTPSFTITPDKGIFYCYGCHKGGDIFKFVEEIEGVSFVDALKTLAERAGVPLENYDKEATSKTSVLRSIMEDATKFYEVGLRTNKSVVDYLLGRKMTKETMIAFRIGYAEKGWSRLYEFLKKKNYRNEDILATGLCLPGKQGLYDRFRERIMFPISDNQGRVIAFTGRVMPGTEEASKPVGKYINSPETDLYHKSSILFAFDKAKTSIHAEDFVIIVEGQMDCIMSHQAGIKNVVALSGTAATEEQMKQIRRFTDKVAICLDADDAGLAAAQKTAIIAYAQDMRVAVLNLGTSKDPADLIAENPEHWKQCIEGRQDMISFRLEKMKERNEMSEKKMIAEKELFPLLRHISSQITLDDKLQEIAHAFGLSSSGPLRKEFENYLNKNPKESAPTPFQSIPQKSFPIDKQLDILEKIIKGESPGEENEKEMIGFVKDLEQKLGSPIEAKAHYERLHKNLLIKKELEVIDTQKQQLDKELANNPHNTDTLHKIQELLRRKDTLIHQVIHHL